MMSAFIMLYLYDTPQEVFEACGSKVAGCAYVRGNACDVHVMRPQIGYSQDYDVIGHEFWHCYFGGFHNGQ